MHEWRRAVREMMRKATEQEALDRFGDITPSFNYRWEHVTAVVTLALKLAHLTGADTEIVEAAAWLHDVRKDAGGDHAHEGAQFARQFLPQTNFPPEKIEGVARAIADHMGLWREKPLTNLESMVLWDADKLAKLGLTAAFHWTGWGLAGNDPQTMAELIARGKENEWQQKTVASMHTVPARRAAQDRLKAFNTLWQNLEAELNAEDLQEA